MVAPQWTVLSEAGRNTRSQLLLNVVCTCGTTRIITEDSYKRGLSKSCGCYRITSRHSRASDGKPSPTYYSWQSMKTRCLNPNAADYPHYGGRGITVDPTWMYFPNFLKDMGVRPAGCTLDRVDVNKGYSPDNCRWATNIEQRANQRPHKRSVKNVPDINLGR